MDDAVELGLSAQVSQSVGIGKVEPFELETVSVIARQGIQPGLFQRRIVIGIEIVDADHAVATRK